MGYADGTNLTHYTKGNPVARLDPSGNACGAGWCTKAQCQVNFRVVLDDLWDSFSFEGNCPSEVYFSPAYRRRMWATLERALGTPVCLGVYLSVAGEWFDWGESGCFGTQTCKLLRNPRRQVDEIRNVFRVNSTYNVFYRLRIGGPKFSYLPFTIGQEPCHVTVRNVEVEVVLGIFQGVCRPEVSDPT